MTPPRLRPVGERGFLVSWGEAIDPDVSARVRGVGRVIGSRTDVAETVAGFCTLLVILSAAADRSRFVREVRAVLAAPPASPPPGRLLTIPVIYGGTGGPDLPLVAQRAGLPPEEVVAAHASMEYLVYVIGFAPGFPYLGILPEGLRLPRRHTPRPRVPAGSVGVADRLTGIYPHETPGGWHLIGRTPLRLFDPGADPPALLAPGDRVRFLSVEADRFLSVEADRSLSVEADRFLSGDADRFSEDTAPSAQPPIPTAAGGPARPVLTVRTPGLLTSVQDGGRRGYRGLGVPWSGSMDPRYHALANARAGNSAAAAALEMTWPAPVLEALDDIVCALAGPEWAPVVDGRPADTEGPIALRRGQLLECRRRGTATWAYLAIAGAIDVAPVLGSRSTYLRGGFGGVAGRTVRAGDVLGRGEVAHRPRRLPSPKPSAEDRLMLRVIPGPQEAHFTEEGFQRLLTEEFTVTTQIDRTGYRLRGPAIGHATSPDVLPEGTLPGAIQVPGDGQPIALMADGPTTGGYPKIATVVADDLPRLAQAAPGARVRFRPVSTAGLVAPAARSRFDEEA